MAWTTWLAWWIGVIADPAPASVGSTIELRWHAPASCPSGTEVATRIATRIADGTPVVEASTRSDAIVADLVVAVENDSHVADLVITTTSGRTIRRLEAADCETVTDAAVLIVAMVHAQSQSAPREDPVVPAPAPAVAPPPKPAAAAPRPAPVPAPARKKTPVVRGSAFAELAVGFAGLPGVGPGLGGGLALLRGMLRVELLGRFWFARDADIGVATQDARVDVRLWTVGAHAGPVLRAGPVEIALLVGGHAGLAHGRGDDLPIVRSARRPWVSLGAYPALLWPLHPRVALGLRGTVEGVAYRPRFTVREGGRAVVASPVTGALAAVVEVRFP